MLDGLLQLAFRYDPAVAQDPGEDGQSTLRRGSLF
jgi:hypothetical protein